MEEFIASGNAIDAILALVALEAVLISYLRLRKRTGPELFGYFANLLAGACLLLALRGALMGASGRVIASTLAVAFVMHLADLAARWVSREPAAATRRSESSNSIAVKV